MLTKRKIDFFGGLHGNYLELVVNYWIDQNTSYDIDLPQFSENGACHAKNSNKNYVPITVANHYSHFGIKFNDNDLVIRIVPLQDDLLIAVTNSFLRAGDQTLDLEELEFDTYHKMSLLPKLKVFLDTLVKQHGQRSEYPRSVLRKYFYSMFDDREHGLDMFTSWLPTENFYNFNLRDFFDYASFFKSLHEIAKFVNLEFTPTLDLVKLHRNFLQVNQGYVSEIKCNGIVDTIVSQEQKFIKLNIVEEAWVNYKLSRVFNIYDMPELEDDIYPTDTKIISQICYNKGTMC